MWRTREPLVEVFSTSSCQNSVDDDKHADEIVVPACGAPEVSSSRSSGIYQQKSTGLPSKWGPEDLTQDPPLCPPKSRPLFYRLGRPQTQADPRSIKSHGILHGVKDHGIRQAPRDGRCRAVDVPMAMECRETEKETVEPIGSAPYFLVVGG